MNKNNSSNIVAISFLGIGKFDKEKNEYYYEKTKYNYQNSIVETDLFPHAVSEFVKPDRLFVIMTEKAKKVNEEKLKALCNFEEIKIPNGKSEEEFWEIFDKITEVINENDEVVFDITHGFRSQPFIIIVLLLYLKALKNIKIKSILYGAYEAGDKEKKITPVFELKSFVELVEWSNAVSEFKKNGNMRYLGEILSNIQRIAHINKKENSPKSLSAAGKSLNNLTDAFETIRVKEVFENTTKFNKHIDEYLEDIDKNTNAKPFGELLKIITKKFSEISEAEEQIFTNKGLAAQKAIINWYYETEKYQKAITLAREYIVTKYMKSKGNIKNEEILIGKESRSKYEIELGQLKNKKKEKITLSEIDEKYADIWQRIIDVRNDINHASMDTNSQSSDSIIKSTKKIIVKINEFF